MRYETQRSLLKNNSHKCILRDIQLLPMTIIVLLFLSAINSFTYCQEIPADKPVLYRYNSSLTGENQYSIKNKPKYKWKTQLPETIKSCPVIDNDNVYVGCNDNFLYCLGLSKGEIKWKFEADAEIEASPSIYKNNVYVSTSNGSIYAIDKIKGTKLWEYTTDGKIVGTPNIYKPAQDIPAKIVIGSYDNFIYCLDSQTGKVCWKIEAANYINGTISIYKDKAIIGSCDGFLYIINLESGELAHKIDCETYIPGWAASANNITYVGNYDGKVRAFNLSTFEKLWTYDNSERPILEGPSISNSVNSIIFSDSDGYITSIDSKSGKKKWEFHIDDKQIFAPLLIGEHAICPSENGFIYILNIKDGTVFWKYLIGDLLTTPAYADSSYILATDASGRIYCFSY